MSTSHRIPMVGIPMVGILMVGVIAIALSIGCKKDEPEAEKAAPEKVEKAALGKKEGALQTEESDGNSTDKKKPAERALVRVPPKSKHHAAQKPTAAAKGQAQAAAKHRTAGATGRPTGRPAVRPAAVSPAKTAAERRRAAMKARHANAAADAELDAAETGEEPSDDLLGTAPAGPRRGAHRPGLRARNTAAVRLGGRRGGPSPPEAGAALPPRGMPPVVHPRTLPRQPPLAHPPVGAGATALPSRVRPNAELLLRRDDLVELLDVKSPFDVHALDGVEPSEEYDAIYWGSPDGSKYLAGVQIWRPRSPIQAQRRYTQMVRSYPNAEENTAITNKTFLGHWNEFIYLAFFDSGKQTVVSLTCHRNICNEPKKLVLLALRVKERL